MHFTQALGYFESESELDDFYAGGLLVDRRGLKHFPRLWCADGEYSSYGQLLFTPLAQQVGQSHDGHRFARSRLEVYGRGTWRFKCMQGCLAITILAAVK